jgi:hypothetical protein
MITTFSFPSRLKELFISPIKLLPLKKKKTEAAANEYSCSLFMLLPFCPVTLKPSPKIKMEGVEERGKVGE